MRLKTRTMKFINNRLTVAFMATVFAVFFANAQEVIKDTVKPTTPIKTFQKKTNKRTILCEANILQQINQRYQIQNQIALLKYMRNLQNFQEEEKLCLNT